jgi:hypothetical protein
MAEGAHMLGRASKYPERVPGRASRLFVSAARALLAAASIVLASGAID